MKFLRSVWNVHFDTIKLQNRRARKTEFLASYKKPLIEVSKYSVLLIILDNSLIFQSKSPYFKNLIKFIHRNSIIIITRDITTNCSIAFLIFINRIQLNESPMNRMSFRRIKHNNLAIVFGDKPVIQTTVSCIGRIFNSLTFTNKDDISNLRLFSISFHIFILLIIYKLQEIAYNTYQDQFR